ncbi:MAG: hypothetical protein K2M75_05645 [Clostridia bacterium]|nr:hypothetical protein [Clostridia bacterium]
MIKFPTTISEYTDNQFWYRGIDESIARRILVDLRKIQDEKELDLRKMYLAHFYCKIGNYRLAMTLAKGFLLENKLVDDAVALIKKICMADRDVENFATLIKLIDRLYHGNPPLSFFNDADGLDALAVAYEDRDTGKGQIIYDANMANYYQDGNLIFSVEDKNYDAFVKDSAARYLLSEGQPEEAIDMLLKLNMSKLKTGVRLFCHQTLARAYCMLGKFDEAYGYVELLMQNDVYMPEMTDIFMSLYAAGSPHFNEMKEFFLNYKHFGNIQLGDMHSLAKDIDDEDFWEKIYDNNPIDPSDISEETYLFKGILAFNNHDYQLSDRLFKRSGALYGSFGKSMLYRYFLDCYLKKLKKGNKVDGMPSQLYTARVDDVYDFIDKKLFSKLKKCLSKEDFVKSAADNMLELDNMLSGVSTKVYDIAEIVNRVYGFNYLPARDLIKKVVVDDEYNVFIRAVCLAVYMMQCGKKKLILGKYIYENPFIRNFKIDEDRQPFAYGIAIYAALTMLGGADKEAIEDDCNILQKIYSTAAGNFSQISPLAVFGVIIAYFSEEKVQYDKDVVKRREVKEFAKVFVDGTMQANKSAKFDDEDIFDFYRLCLDVLGKK